MSGVPICLHISGDHVALESLADSIDKQALSAIRSRVGALRANEVNFEPSWSGKAADAFVSCCLELGNDFDNQISVYLDNAGEVIRAYAWRIRRGKELFDDYGETAVNAGLIKQGDYVLPPTSRRAGDRSGPCSVTDVDPDQLHVPSPFTLFDEISERVQQWHREHSIWILTYFEQLIKRAEKATELSKLLSAFEVDESTIVGLALEGSNHGVTKRLERLQESTDRHRADFERYTKAKHAGLYEMSAGEKPVTGRAFKDGLGDVEQSLDNWRRVGSIIDSAGHTATVVESVNEVMNGEEYGSVGMGAAGGAAGSAAGARFGARFGLAGVLIFGGAGAAFGSGAGKLAWEEAGDAKGAHLSLGNREEIIYWFTQPGSLTAVTPRMA